MNTPDDVAINFDDELAWLLRYRTETGLSWPRISQLSGIPSGTLSSYKTPRFEGNRATAAERLFRFRQKVQSQTERKRFLLDRPRWIETPSARRVQVLLEIAHMGRITVGAMGPGVGKTVTAQHYRDALGDTVWIATMRPTTETLTAMMQIVAKSMGIDARSTAKAVISNSIIEHVRHRRGLLIVDEAGHLPWGALEELRAWHDETELGIALLGNQELLQRINARGNNRHSYARLASRIANSHVQDMPIEADIEAYLDAHDIVEPEMRRPLIKQGLSAGHGGLREVQQIIESATMLAIGDDSVISAEYILDAIKGRSTVQMRFAS